jgi:hypothetical protein
VISAAIIHCPRSSARAENVRELRAALPDAVVVEDDGHAVGTRWDRRGCWPIARRAWLTSCASHHLVLEDDAQLCSGFFAHVERIAAEHHNACVSFFRGSRDCSVATLMPCWLVNTWIEWTEESKNGARYLPHHDYLITQGMRELGVPHLYTEPSLVDQRAFDSLLGHRHIAATRFEQDPSDVALVARG